MYIVYTYHFVYELYNQSDTELGGKDRVGRQRGGHRCRQDGQTGMNEGGGAGRKGEGYKCRKTDVERSGRSDVQVYMQSLRTTGDEDVCIEIAG